MDPFCHLCFVFVFVILACLFLAALWSPVGKGLSFSSLVCGIFLVFWHFPMWCPGSDVVPNCINS